MRSVLPNEIILPSDYNLRVNAIKKIRDMLVSGPVENTIYINIPDEQNWDLPDPNYIQARCLACVPIGNFPAGLIWELLHVDGWMNTIYRGGHDWAICGIQLTIHSSLHDVNEEVTNVLALSDYIGTHLEINNTGNGYYHTSDSIETTIDLPSSTPLYAVLWFTVFTYTDWTGGTLQVKEILADVTVSTVIPP